MYEQGSKYRGSPRIDENIREGPLKGSHAAFNMRGSFQRISDGIQNSERNYQCTEVVAKICWTREAWENKGDVWTMLFQFNGQTVLWKNSVKCKTLGRLSVWCGCICSCIGCCCASPVVWCKQKHIYASLSRCVCSMVTFVFLGVMWTVPLVYLLLEIKKNTYAALGI